MVAVDEIVVTANVASFGAALQLVMAMYFNLNIKYSTSVTATLEFIQR